MTLLRVRDLAVARGGARALEGISFDLEPGEALILRGPNGIGKTTLLRTVAGLQPPVEGTVEAAPDGIAYAAHADGLKGALVSIDAVSDGDFGKMVALRGTDVVRVPLDEALAAPKLLDPALFETAEVFFG